MSASRIPPPHAPHDLVGPVRGLDHIAIDVAAFLRRIEEVLYAGVLEAPVACVHSRSTGSVRTELVELPR